MSRFIIGALGAAALSFSVPSVIKVIQSLNSSSNNKVGVVDMDFWNSANNSETWKARLSGVETVAIRDCALKILDKVDSVGSRSFDYVGFVRLCEDLNGQITAQSKLFDFDRDINIRNQAMVAAAVLSFSAEKMRFATMNSDSKVAKISVSRVSDIETEALKLFGYSSKDYGFGR